MILIWLAFYVTYLVCAAVVIPRSTFKRYEKAPRDWQHRAAHILFYSIPVSYFFGADDPQPLTVLLSLVLFVAGGALVIWAVASNPWFSPAIEMPPMVVTDEAYGWFRHPGYTGFGLMAVASWLMIGATWALIPLAAYLALLAWRGWRESKLLY